jgi:hypothetical protein
MISIDIVHAGVVASSKQSLGREPTARAKTPLKTDHHRSRLTQTPGALDQSGFATCTTDTNRRRMWIVSIHVIKQ